MEEKNPKLRRIERDVEHRIREMNETGQLRGLAGHGAPLPGDDGGPPDTWAARRLMRNAGAQPEWADLRRDIDTRTEKLRLRVHAHRQWLHDRTRLLAELPADRILETMHATTVRDTRVRAELEAALGAVNALVRRYDLMVPPLMQLPLLTLDRMESSDERLTREERDR